MLLAVVALAAAACGNDGSPGAEGAAELQTTTTAAPTTTAAAATTTTTAPTTTTTASPTTTTTTTTTAPPTTTTAEASEEAAPASAAEPGEAGQAAMDAWAIVFDSEIDFVEKAPHLENAPQLESTIVAYAETGAQFGGVSLEPTAVSLDGDVAAITYNVLFGGSAAYSDLSGEMQLVDGVWVVSRDTFCGFMASARTPCRD